VMLGPSAFSQRDRAARPRPLLRHMVGDVLRRTRVQQGRTLSDVARAARVSLPYLSELERGRKEASSEILAAICDALRIELSDLLAQVGSDLAGEAARKAPALRLGASDGKATASSRPQAPRALAGVAPAQPESLPAQTAAQPAAPADLAAVPADLAAHPRTSADAQCLLAA